MKYLKIVLFAALVLCLSNLNAQENVPPELLGKWKIVNVYAVDSLGNTIAGETASLMDDLVNDNVVEYGFTDSTFTLYINGVASGSCGYIIQENTSQLIFDANALAMSDVVRELQAIEITETDLHLEAASPDINSGIKFQEFLVKQP
ncbi:MAG: hypothetical protein R2728_03015 [Chitinophagales bacterium]